MRAILMLLVLALGSALPAAALTLDLPVSGPGRGTPVAGPAYRGDIFELRLTPAAARIGAGRTVGLTRADALGVAGVDRVAALLGGVWFEPEFRGETAPAPGSNQPDFTAFYLAHLPPGLALEDALERFRPLGEVISADPIAVLPVSFMPNDELWPDSWWFYQPGTRHDIHAPEAWDVSTGDTAVVVAVLDTGVLPYHPDLLGQIWTNWVEAGGAPNVDDDGNGFKDDIHGWDFVSYGANPQTGEDWRDEDNDPNDFAGHGTAVAGLVGALTDNVIGVAGTVHKVRLMPVRMGWSATNGPSGVVDMSFAAKAILYATRMGAQVINCSWASLNLSGLDAAVTAAVQAGVTVVYAAGNNNSFHYLGDRDDVIAIAATLDGDNLAGFSNYGTWVDLSAPGAGIRSTFCIQAGTDSLSRRQPSYMGPRDGTSFSAPMAAGVAALVQARYVPPYTHRLLTPRGVQLRLMETADDVSALNPGIDGLYGAGRLNAYRALVETSGSTATRALAQSVGSQVLIPTNAEADVAFLANNQTLVQIDVATQDTVMYQNTFAAPAGSLAAADLGTAAGTALFYATAAAGVYGFAAGNALVPGAWPQAGSAPLPMTGPALGDIDGDGEIEVMSGGDDGRLWVWHADGSGAAGSPIVTGVSPLRAPPALSDLDGAPGAEMIAAALDGTVHAYRAGGAELAGWPVAVGASPLGPVVTRLGSDPSPAVVVVAGNQLHAFSSAGVERAGFPVVLGGTAAQDPALADIDGDGYDEILVVTDSPPGIEVRDSSGVGLSALGWPRPLSAPAQGPLVVGELSTASPGPELLIMRGGALLALERDGDTLKSFPKPGGAGTSPSLVQADADGAVEVLAGTGTDSLFYIYDAGPGSAGAGPIPWPTARGNFARTGSRLYDPPLGSLDEVPPAVITDLRVTARTDSSISFAWTAAGDDGMAGRPRNYAIRAALQPLDEAGFETAPLQHVVAATVDAGGAETFVFDGLAEGTAYWFAVKGVDDANNRPPLSNVVATQTEVGAPLRAALVVLEQPSRGSATFSWRASADGVGGRQTIHIFDVTGRRLRVLDVGGGVGGKRNWDGRDSKGHSVPAGLYYARLLSGSVHTQTRLVLLP